MTVEVVTSLVEELVGLADQLEGLGLVDYQMGFAEEQIVAGFMAGLELVAGREGDAEQQQQQQQGMSGHGHPHGQQMAVTASRG